MAAVAWGRWRWLGVAAGVVLALLSDARRSVAQQVPPIGGGGITPMCAGGCVAGVYVTPVPGSVTVGANQAGVTAKFVVENQFSYDVEIVNAVCSRTGAVASCGSVTPATLMLGPSGGYDTVRVTFATGAVGTGTVALTVYHDAGTGSPKTGTQAVSVTGGPPAPQVVLRNQPDRLERGLCLTTGAGEAAVQCGDLLVAHSLPAYRTLGRDRSLALVYNSATAVPRPVLAVAVTPGATVTAVEAVLKVGPIGGTQIQVASASYAGSGWTGTRQVVLSYDAAAAGQGTGVYAYTLEVRSVNGAQVSTPTVLTGRLINVDRRTSALGTGWAVAGVEFIQGQASATPWPNVPMLWVAGDGSARIYEPLGYDAKWVAPVGAYRDTIVLSGGTYTRTLRHGVQVQYDGNGRHVKTISRTGQETVFAYDGSGRLSTITVPPGSAGGTYTLTYAGTTLDKITDPATRILDATMNGSGRLTGLTDPDGVSVEFQYDGAGRLIKRKNRLAYWTRFEYTASGLRLGKAHVPYGPTGTDTARTEYQAWDEKGLAVGATGQVAVDTAQAVTSILGPRDGVNDNATISVDRWGAPTKIVDPLGATTTIQRASPVCSALVTFVRYANTRSVRMLYDTTTTSCKRGNLLQVRDSVPGGTGTGSPVVRTTTYAYASPHTLDAPSQVTDPMARVTSYTYTPLGLLATATDPRGHVTAFTYEETVGHALRGEILTVTEQNVETWEEQAGAVDDTLVTDALRHHVTRYGYDTKGNIDSVAAPHGAVTAYMNDAAGRTTRMWDPLGMVTELVFDPLNRVTEQRRFRLPNHYTHPFGLGTMVLEANQVETTDTTTRALPTGFPTLVTAYTQGPAGLEILTNPRTGTRRFAYDARLAVREEKDEFLAARGVVLNAAGQVASTTDRDGVTVQHTYDAAGRQLTTTYPARVLHGQTIPGDTETRTYDPLTGNLLTAANKEGTTVREYWADGSLKARYFTRAGGQVMVDTASYEYNAAGQRTRLVHSADAITYAYHATSGDLTTMTVQWGGVARPTRTITFGWDGLGRRRSISYSAGPTVQYRYDKLGTLRRLKSTLNGLSTNNLDFTALVDQVDVTGRTLHRKTRCKVSGSAVAHSACEGATTGITETTQRYDRLGLLVSSALDAERDSLRYDVAGNITERRSSVSESWHTHLLVGVSDRLAKDSSAGGGVRTFTYDQSGARTAEYLNGVKEREYYYDGLGRTTGLQHWVDVGGTWQIGGTSDACRYDPDGQVLKPCTNGAPLLAYDGANVLGVLGASNSTRVTFVHGPGVDDPLLALIRGNGANDNVKELIWVTDGGGRQYAVGGYDGRRPGAGFEGMDIDQDAGSQYGGWQWVGGTTRSFGFSAARQSPRNADLGFSVFRNRLYDPRTGRWTQEDPLGVAGGINLYQFNGNNPASLIDPFGLKPCPERIAALREKTQLLKRRIDAYMTHARRGTNDKDHLDQLNGVRDGLNNDMTAYHRDKCDDDDDFRNAQRQATALINFELPEPAMRYGPGRESLSFAPADATGIGAPSKEQVALLGAFLTAALLAATLVVAF